MALMIFPKRYSYKPPLGAQVNWSHPLAAGLIGCWLFNEGGGQQFIDLGKYGQKVASAAQAPAYISTPEGTVVDCTAAEGKYFTVTRRGADIQTSGAPLTVMGRIRMYSGQQQGCLVNYGEVTDNNFTFSFGVNGGNGHLSCGNNGSANVVDSTFTTTALKWQTVGVSQSSGSARTFFMDGSSAADATSIAGGATAGGLSLLAGFINQAVGANSTQFGGQVSWIFVWNRPLSVGEMQQIYQDNFTFILPQSPRLRYFSAPVAGGGTTYNVASSFNISTGFSLLDTATLIGSITAAITAGFNNSNSGTLVAATTLTETSGFSLSASGVLGGSMALNETSGLAVADIATIFNSVTFAATMGASFSLGATYFVSMAALNLATGFSDADAATLGASTVMSVISGLSAAAQAALVGSCGFAITTGTAAASIAQFSRACSLAVTMGETFSNTATLVDAMALGATMGYSTVIASTAYLLYKSLSSTAGVLATGDIVGSLK